MSLGLLVDQAAPPAADTFAARCWRPRARCSTTSITGPRVTKDCVLPTVAWRRFVSNFRHSAVCRALPLVQVFARLGTHLDEVPGAIGVASTTPAWKTTRFVGQDFVSDFSVFRL